MNIKKTTFATLLVLVITGCTIQPERQGVAVVNGDGRAPISISHNNVTHKRINTTECQDSDDWYLDGYRVGKSFSTQKTQMLHQRIGYCQLSLKTLPKQFKLNWERGFTVGNHKNGKIKNKQNRQARKKV